MRSLRLARARWPFVGLQFASITAHLGNALSAVVYPWLVYDLTRSAAWMGVVAFVTLGPTVIGAALGSVVVERFGVRRMALLSGMLGAVAAVMIATMHHAGELTISLLILLGLLGAVLDGPGMVAIEARVPEIARLARMPLIRANAVDDFVDSSAAVLGPVLAAFLVAATSTVTMLWIIAAVSSAALLLLALSLPRFRPLAQTHATLADVTTGVGFVMGMPILRASLLLAALGTAVFVAIEAVLLPAILRADGLSADRLGWFFGATGIGAIAVNAALALRRRTPPIRALFVTAFLGLSVGVGLLTIDRSIGTLITAGALLGLAAGPLSPVFATLLQTTAPKAVRARVIGVTTSLVMGAAPLSALAAGLALEWFGASPVLLGCAVLLGLCAALAAVLPGLGEQHATHASRVVSLAPRPQPPIAGPIPAHPGSVSLARASLLYEWRRYLAAILAVAFSGLLVIVQLGLLIGMFATVSTLVDKASADLWVVDGKTQSFDMAREMPARIEFRLHGHPDVEAVQTITIGMGDWRTPAGGKVMATLVGFDVTDASLSLPNSFASAQRVALRQVGAVMVDEIDLGKFGVKVGDVAEINGHSVTVVGTTTGMRATGVPNVLASKATVASLSSGAPSGGSSYFLLKVRDGVSVERTRAALQALSADDEFKVLTPQELSHMSQAYWVTESGVGVGFGFSAILALMVGIAITSQTLRGAILATIREYATLRALGVSVSALRRVVIEQSFWVGVAGLIVTAAITASVYALAVAASVAIGFPWWSIIGTALFTLAVALLSGLLSLRPLYRTEPAELLR